MGKESQKEFKYSKFQTNKTKTEELRRIAIEEMKIKGADKMDRKKLRAAIAESPLNVVINPAKGAVKFKRKGRVRRFNRMTFRGK